MLYEVITVEKLQVARELLDAVDVSPALDLHGDGLAGGVAGQDVV